MTAIQSTAKTVSTSLAAEIVDTICEDFGYTPNDDGSGTGTPQPLTKVQFAQSKLDQHLYGWIKNAVVHRRRRNTVVDETTTGL